jgi:hypothetical protein
VIKVRLRHLLILTSVVALSAADTARVATSGPVKDYSVSFFSEAGYHRMKVQGSSADLRNPKAVRLDAMTLTLFSGEADRAVESVLMAPIAIIEPETELVRGSEAVRLVRDDLELFGEDWSYDHLTGTIHLRRNAKIIFNASLADYLK